MAIAIYADDTEFGAMHYGLPRSEDRAAIRSRLENTARSYGMVGSEMYDRAMGRFNSFNFDKIERKIDALKRRITHLFDHDEIRPMCNIGDFQQAGPEQQRWIMANPRAKRLFEKDMINGYRGSHKSRFPGKFGEDDPDYQQVTHGLFDFDDEGNAVATQYLHLLDDDGRTELTFGRQTTIRDSMWANFSSILDLGQDDPSDKENGSL